MSLFQACNILSLVWNCFPICCSFATYRLTLHVALSLCRSFDSNPINQCRVYTLQSTSAVLNLRFADHWWSAAVCPVIRRQGLTLCDFKRKIYANKEIFPIFHFFVSVARKQADGSMTHIIYRFSGGPRTETALFYKVVRESQKVENRWSTCT